MDGDEIRYEATQWWKALSEKERNKVYCTEAKMTSKKAFYNSPKLITRAYRKHLLKSKPKL